METIERGLVDDPLPPNEDTFQKIMVGHTIFHPQSSHKIKDYFHLKAFAEKVLKLLELESHKPKTSKKNDLDKGDKADFPQSTHDIMYIFGGPDSYESKRKQKLMTREVFPIEPTNPEFLHWLKNPITFDRFDHPSYIPHLGRQPLILGPTIGDARLQ